MVPILDEVGIKLEGKIRVVKIDADKYPRIAGQYRIEALPTFHLVQGWETLRPLCECHHTTLREKYFAVI